MTETEKKVIETEIPEPSKDPNKDKAGLAKAFAAYDKAELGVVDAEKKLAAAQRAKSMAVKEIADYGKVFNRKGQQLILMRKNDSWYFRGPGTVTGISVE